MLNVLSKESEEDVMWEYNTGGLGTKSDGNYKTKKKLKNRRRNVIAKRSRKKTR